MRRQRDGYLLWAPPIAVVGLAGLAYLLDLWSW